MQQGGYSVVDLFGSYAVNSHLNLQLNVNNLFDKRYYSSISEPIGGNFFGDPRNFLLSARYRF
ncbi:MAG: Fe(3+)-pyochelin receptor [Pseudomonas citronellolis]|nr:MAG: Fe(3+)-pyochelin receptor [Pseudomonas citronellolis]